MKKELQFAKKLARRAGEIILKHFQRNLNERIKEDKTIVTIADDEINSLVINAVKENYPGHGVFGEEKSLEKESDLMWLCDPIDGKGQYSRGLPVAVFSLALVQKGIPGLGVVYDPFTDRLYSAVKGKDAFLNGEKISVSSHLVEGATVDVEWWPTAEHDLVPAMHKFSKDFSTFPYCLGSVINASCLVASGKYEACVFAGTKGKTVDIAAVKVIVEEAGGKVTDLFGKEQKYFKDINGAVMTNGIIHDEILNYTGQIL